MVTFILLVIGGINWLLLGIFNWEIGILFGGQTAIVSKIIYILVGLSAIYEFIKHSKMCACCNCKSSDGKMGNNCANCRPGQPCPGCASRI